MSFLPGYRVPSKVDVEKTEPCANPDIYEHILKYHCGDDMYIPDDVHSSSGSWYSGPSGTHSDGTLSLIHISEPTRRA